MKRPAGSYRSIISRNRPRAATGIVIALAAGLLLSAAPAGAYPTITYVEGEVGVVREHRSLRPDLLFGARLEPFDFVATGADAVAEMHLGEDEPAVRVRLDPDSAIMLHPFAADAADRLVVELVHGSLSLDAGDGRPVAILLREGRVEVVGGAITVARGAAGGLRVEAREGRASVRIDEAVPPRLFASPDAWVVYSTAPPAFENVEPTGGVAGWRSARLVMAAMDASTPAARSAASAYPPARREFDRAYRDLIDAEPAILDWIRNADLQRMLSDATADAIEAPLAELEEARRDFEPLFHGLDALAPVVGADTLPEHVSRDGRIITERLHTARQVLRLFFERRGRMPQAEDGVPARGM